MKDARDRPGLPVDPQTGEALEPRRQPGYYPRQQCLSQQAFWDEATRKVVLARVEDVPPVRFFNPAEAAFYAAVFERLLPQDDRDVEHRIPILNFVDARLWQGLSDGFRYEDMPPDREAFRLGREGIQAASHALHGREFLELTPSEQESVLKTLHAGKPPPGAEALWSRMNPRRFFLLLLSDVTSAYYAHPYAWDEIGFGGPAYPRGYMRLERGLPEPWEAHEERYEWQAPPGTLTDVYEPEDSTEQTSSPGQGGTH